MASVKPNQSREWEWENRMRALTPILHCGYRPFVHWTLQHSIDLFFFTQIGLYSFPFLLCAPFLTLGNYYNFLSFCFQQSLNWYMQWTVFFPSLSLWPHKQFRTAINENAQKWKKLQKYVVFISLMNWHQIPNGQAIYKCFEK